MKENIPFTTWCKDSGRMYAHNIISFHRDEKITEAEALNLARVFAEKYVSGFQYVICVHQDKDHIHAHIGTNKKIIKNTDLA